MRYFSWFLLLMMFVTGGCAFVNVPLVPPPSPLEEQILEGEGNKKILLLDISGSITEQEKSGGLLGRNSASMVSLVHESLQKAEHDDDVSAVVLRINSPGGTVTASDIIYHDVMEFKKRRKIPVIACIMSTGASGGYYVAAAADEIVAHPTSIVGSIGVIMMKFNVEGLMGKIGVEEQTVKSGDKKDIMSPFRKATAEEIKLGQEIIDQLYARFLEVILARNGNSLKSEELKKLSDGRVYTAKQALNSKLVDRIAYLDEVISGLKTKNRMQEMKVVTYYRPGNFKGSIYAGGEQQVSLIEMLGSFDPFAGSSFMYLWKP